MLRSAGLRVGPAATLAAIDAVAASGLDRREDVYWSLHATLVTRHEDSAVFDEAFALFWRSRDLTEKMIAMFSPKAPPRPEAAKRRPGSRRAEDAIFEGAKSRETRQERPEIEIDARLTSSQDDLLRAKDFAAMSASELDAARRAVTALALPHDRIATRRFEPARLGTFDARRTLRLSLRTGGDLILPAFRRRRTEPPPIVILADISGSMSRYSEIFLHFAHALTERRRVQTLLFGTRLTNVTRQMRHRDPDEALALCGASVSDWSGGTRIGSALARFNRDWSRRVLGQGALVLLITDGLELGDTRELAVEAERLHKSCRRLVWLSPLLGYEGFAAKARGVRALLGHVDEFRPVHSIAAIDELCRALSGKTTAAHDPRRWLMNKAA